MRHVMRHGEQTLGTQHGSYSEAPAFVQGFYQWGSL